MSFALMTKSSSEMDRRQEKHFTPYPKSLYEGKRAMNAFSQWNVLFSTWGVKDWQGESFSTEMAIKINNEFAHFESLHGDRSR